MQVGKNSFRVNCSQNHVQLLKSPICLRFNFLHRNAFQVWGKNPKITILGNEKARRLPIFSLLIHHPDSGKILHHNFVSVLLNDLYGIQARGGCACAGPYAQVWFTDDEYSVK